MAEILRLLARIPRAALIAQLVAMGVLGSLHILVTWAPKGTFHPLLTRLVGLDYEMNIPTWFASTQWLVLAIVLGAVAIVARKSGRSRRHAWIWTCGAAAAAYMSADEVGIIHETLGTILEDAAKASSPGSVLHFIKGFPSYFWILLYAPIAIPAAAFLVAFAWRVLGPARRTALLGLFVFLYAAVGLDFIEGRFGAPDHQSFPISVLSRHFNLDIYLAEEMLEMLGVALFLTASLRHLAALAERAAAGTVDPGLLRVRPAAGIAENPRQVGSRWAGLFAAPTIFRAASLAPVDPDRFVHSPSESKGLSGDGWEKGDQENASR